MNDYKISLIIFSDSCNEVELSLNGYFVKVFPLNPFKLIEDDKHDFVNNK